ncbi:hypothetical protein PCASD_22903 [Puccinia coronata f. sp. avenae]|uniref:Uncharacterized protein n=1 Tax=Puccinia coronata f. sp. avenae TaxID=200324 RepID=A0A2N5U304_9BASI|nr:hypothetical protein PCASD_22903 [Puccinia coronata f. sp. avenae]
MAGPVRKYEGDPGIVHAPDVPAPSREQQTHGVAGEEWWTLANKQGTRFGRPPPHQVVIAK